MNADAYNPAFPAGYDKSSPGLTKREYIAAQLMAALLSKHGPYYNPKEAANHAVKHADALMEELGKPVT